MPTEQPYRFVERRRIFGGADTPRFSEPVAKRHRGEREWAGHYDKDASLLVGRESRRTLMSLGRGLYHNSSIVRGALNEMASYATSSFIPQFDGIDREWGDTAEDWLYNHDRVCDVRGWPYGMDALNRLIILSVLRDGDVFVLLTESPAGWPMFQLVPAHRVGSRSDMEVKRGPFAGYPIIDGAVVNPYGRPVAYNVLGDTEDADRIIDTRSLIPVYLPEYADQVRGFSALACSAIDFQDVQESRRLELIAQKLLAAITLVESNETGGPDPATTLVGGLGAETGGEPTIASKEFYGGEVRYVRAGSGGGINPVVGDRPTANQRQFADGIIRQALQGLGWSIDFSLDPTKVGGALGRVVVSKINFRLNELRHKLLAPVRRVMDGYRIAKAINLGLVPASDEWMQWAYQGPGNITADAKHASDVSRQELQLGLTSIQKECASRGEWWQDVIDDKLEAAQYIIREAERRGIPVHMIQMMTPNGNVPNENEQEPKQPDESEE